MFLQRLTEPLHLNLISLYVLIFGSLKKKIAYDLVLRPQHAYGVMHAAEQAKKQGLGRITVIEFGVANGAGLMNLINISQKVTSVTGVEIEIFGFDTGRGMPEPLDYRDHPEYYNTGDFPMNSLALEKEIKNKAKIIYGDIENSLKAFISTLSCESPIGFVTIDVDYYSSCKNVLELFKSEATYFLPLTYVYLDDIFMPHHNSRCGELLAVSEFNAEASLRVLKYHQFFMHYRIFKNANWVKQIYFLHLLNHPYRSELKRNRETYVLDNPYLKFEGNEKRF